MDLANLDLKQSCEKTVKMVIKHPVSGDALTDDSGKEFYLEFVGSESDIARQARFKHDRKVAEIYTEHKEGSAEREDALINSKSEYAAEILTGWYLVKDGKSVKFSKAECVKVFVQFYWLIPQLFKEHESLANFIKA